MSWLVVGLGNPGPSHEGQRHNIGFMVADELARRSGETWRDKFKGQLARCRVAGADAWVLKPMTYMNRSGIPVGQAASFYKVPPERVVVIHDELEFDWRQVRVKVGGGHGGHNGLRSLMSHFGKDFVRIRCGIGRPRHGDVANYVLTDFDALERAELEDVIWAAADAAELVVAEGPARAMAALAKQAIGATA